MTMRNDDNEKDYIFCRRKYKVSDVKTNENEK